MTKSMNAGWWVKRWSELHPRKTAIVFEGKTITYAMLYGRVEAVASWLRSLGIQKGDRVAIMLNNCPEFLELYLACSTLGAIFVPINFRHVSAEVDYTLKNCRPKVIVFAQECEDVIRNLDFHDYRPLPHVVIIGNRARNEDYLDYEEGIQDLVGKGVSLESDIGPTDPEEPQVIMYTSGTTGEPKGAVLSHRKTFFNCLNADIFFKLSFDDIMLIILPLFHSGGLFIQASPCFYKGATMVIHPRFDPERTYLDMARYKVTKFLGVPTIYRTLLDMPEEKRAYISSLKVCAIGGEKTTPELLLRCKEAGFPVRQIMGQTETSILLWASEEESLARPGTVGRPVFHAEVDLVDRQGRSVSPGEVGEIVVRGSIMMNEYWEDQASTSETIKNGWLHTGDLARKDKDGYFYLVDRAKDMFISGGENVYPAEVERVIKEHPGVEDVAIIGVPDNKWGEVGMAFVQRRQGATITQEEILEFCNSKLARYKIPKKILFVDSLPRTPLGKVKKYLLKERVLLEAQGLGDDGRRGVKRDAWDWELCGDELGGVNQWQSTKQKEAIP